MIVNLERQTDALARAQRHWQSNKGQARPWTIALTREAGTPGAAVAQEIGHRLGWTVYDRELIEKIAQEMGLRASLLSSVDERRKSILLETLESLSLAGPVSEPKFVKHLVETLTSLGAHGHCVIVGRGAAHILPVQSTLRVRLVAEKNARIDTVRNQMNLTLADAERWVNDTDRERLRFVKDHFYKDAADPMCYDLVLNTWRWSIAQCADFVVKALADLEKAR
jgi:cytidylate kinase